MRVVVEVTPGDIVDGVAGDPCRCPIAVAMKRVLPGRVVDVYPDGFIIGGDEIKAPQVAKEFVRCFDCLGTAGPITFEIEVSDDEAAA